MRAVLPFGVTTGSAAAAPTPELWRLCPIEAIDVGRIRGWHLWDDFISFPNLTDQTTASQTFGWTVYGEATSSIKQIADEVGGVIAITGTDDNESVAMTTGGNAGGFLKFDLLHRVWFEARFKVSAIGNTQSGFFVGVTEETMAAADAVIAADSTFANVDYVGFLCPEADGNVCEPVFNKYDGTDVVMEADAHALAVDEYIKAGFLWDPTGRQDRFLEIFFDGTKETQDAYDTVGSKANTMTDTTNFPGSEEMAVTVFAETAATARTLELDWIKCACQPLT